jgi:NADH dehydrogenase
VVIAHRIVVLGAGFAGMACTRELLRQLGRRNDVHVALVDRENYSVYQPLLPEVVSASIAPHHVVSPIRQHLPDVDFDCAAVERVDMEQKLIHFVQLQGIAHAPRPYTHLVLALGRVPNMAVIPGMAAHAFPVKTVGDALKLRNHVLLQLELAANTHEEATRKELLSFVCVGGGFSGVETCAEMYDMLTSALRWYPELRDHTIRMRLVASTDRILPALSTGLSEYARARLTKRGIDVQLEERVTSITPRGCFLGRAGFVPTRTVVAAIGDSTHPLITGLGLPMQRGGVAVDAELRVPGFENLWGIGDCAFVVNQVDGQPCPPTAQVSIPQGKRCADNLVRALGGREQLPFRYKARGYMASLGHRTAVADVLGLRISGLIAWMMWRAIYLAKLPGVLRKLRVLIDWTIDLFFARDIVQLSTSTSERLGRAHFEPGQDIVRQGEPGDAFYTLARGEVEVLKDGVCVARLCEGAFFGEEALLHDRPRSATVRALTAVDVVMVARGDFKAISHHLAVARREPAQEP